MLSELTQAVVLMPTSEAIPADSMRFTGARMGLLSKLNRNKIFPFLPFLVVQPLMNTDEKKKITDLV